MKYDLIVNYSVFLFNNFSSKSCIQIVCEKMKETWDEKQLVPYIAGPYNQPKAGVENVRSIKYKVKINEIILINRKIFF